MSQITIYATLIISVFGIAYPILLQVISKLDDKYDSIQIITLFNSEKPKKWFHRFLVLALFSVFLWTLELAPFPSIIDVASSYPLIQEFLYHSSKLFVIITTIALVVSFFFYVKKILTYYNTTSFIKYLESQHKKHYPNFIYFNSLSDVFIKAIRNQNDNLINTIYRFYFDAFRKERENKLHELVEYPDDYYELIYKSIEELANKDNRRNVYLEYRTAGSLWLLGYEGAQISGKTYHNIWQNLLLSISYEKDDYILYHWKNAHQYYSNNLSHYKENVDQKDRQKFLDFHLTLGALLFYSNRYESIRRIFSFTLSEPPKYVLLPSTMDEIFRWFMKFRNRFDSEYKWISLEFNFPGFDGIQADQKIKYWISKYLSLLFLRQYTIIPYLITMKPLALPKLPEKQLEKQIWLQSLDFFHSLINEIINDNETLPKVELETIKNKVKADGIISPDTFFKQLEKKLREDFNETLIAQEIDPKKKLKFYNESKTIIVETIEELKEILNDSDIHQNFQTWSIDSQKMTLDKDPLSIDPTRDNGNFDTFLADNISEDIRQNILSGFTNKTIKSYLLKKDDLFKAIDKLSINENYLILNVGINIGYFRDQIKKLNDDSYDGIKIFKLTRVRHLKPALYIINKSDLPSLHYGSVDQEIIDNLQLEKIHNNIFGSIIDLHNDEISQEVKNQAKQYLLSNSNPELEKAALINLIHKLEIRWKETAKIIELVMYSEYRQDGIPDSLNDVQSFSQD
ncbi:MAG: hypothetical protein WDZ80_06760 [Candidatus Paceibacterota bacterium]